MQHKYLSDILTEQADMYRKVMPLKSICLKSSVMLPEKRSLFIRPKDKVKIIQGNLVDCWDNQPTHEIVEVFGTLANTDFSFTARDLKTNELITVKL